MSTSTRPHVKKCGNCNGNCGRKGVKHGCFSRNFFVLEQFFNTPPKYSVGAMNDLRFTIFSLPKELLKQLMGRAKCSMIQLAHDLPSAGFPNLSQYTKAKMVSMTTKNLARVVYQTMCTYYSLVQEKDATTCAICLESIDNSKPTCTTKCGHTFCTGCFLQLVQRSQHAALLSCPCCRQNQF